MGLKILLIDDQPESVQAVMDELEASLADTECQIADFKSAPAKLEEMQPDVVILDVMDNTSLGQINEGAPLSREIWKQRFCPLIFYTASDETAEELQHPLVTVIKKGSGSEEHVREKIKSFIPHIVALGKVSTEINVTLRKALRESRPRIFELSEASQENQVLVRSIRRRVAASMDDAMALGEPNLLSWEQYLCPPSNPSHLLTGDIIRLKDAERHDASSYRVVLTPSCDLVVSGERQPKVDRVLLARCTNINRLIADLGLTVPAANSKGLPAFREKIAKFLTQGYGHSSFPIAALPDEFPVMAADFRSLEVVSLDELNDTNRYQRVASVDAPFRELFVWAYLSAAGRPGMPDRDFGPWADSIVTELQKTATPAEPAR